LPVTDARAFATAPLSRPALRGARGVAAVAVFDHPATRPHAPSVDMPVAWLMSIMSVMSVISPLLF
jgi:hypothetical protein